MTEAEKLAERVRNAKRFDVPAGTPVSECRGCKDPIYWIVTENDKRSPISCEEAGDSEPTATEPGRGISHFVNCPNADQFRRRK